MPIKWIALEYIISYTEMLTSCYFSSEIFRQKKDEKRTNWYFFVVFPLAGAALLSMRELEIILIPDFVPSVLIFSLFSVLIQRAKIWMAILWALVNYLLMGIETLSLASLISILLGIDVSTLFVQSEYRIIFLAACRLSQLLISQLLIYMIAPVYRSSMNRVRTRLLIAAPLISIVVLMVLWNTEYRLGENSFLVFIVVVCLLLFGINFFLLFFVAIIAKGKVELKTLQEYNKRIEVQLRRQREVGEIYTAMRSLKHDMNTHLHTVYGYIQMEEYQKAKGYLEKIIGEVNAYEPVHTGNATLDALLGSKGDIARSYGIQVDLEATVPEELAISADHLSVVLGNLYDNAIDANLKIQKDSRYIKIRINYNGGNLLLSFVNVVQEKDINRTGMWATTKENSFDHGFGLKSIDRIVNRYGGFCYREIKDGMFVCQIRMCDKK